MSSAHQNNAYTSSVPPPVLIAPRPSLPPSNYNNSDLVIPPNPANIPPPRHTIFPHNDAPKEKRRRKKVEDSYSDYKMIISTPELCGRLGEKELLILELRYKKGLQWKEVSKFYAQKHTKGTLVAALQMQKTRSMKKLATIASEIALCNPDTVKWTAICTQLQRHLNRKSSKDAMQGQKKWDVQQPKRERIASDLTIESFEHDSWSDGREYTGHSRHDSDPSGVLSAVLCATMDDIRRYDASLQQQLQQQQEYQSSPYAQQERQLWQPRDPGLLYAQQEQHQNSN